VLMGQEKAAEKAALFLALFLANEVYFTSNEPLKRSLPH
jgi:hypothetical protein